MQHIGNILIIPHVYICCCFVCRVAWWCKWLLFPAGSLSGNNSRQVVHPMWHTGQLVLVWGPWIEDQHHTNGIWSGVDFTFLTVMFFVFVLFYLLMLCQLQKSVQPTWKILPTVNGVWPEQRNRSWERLGLSILSVSKWCSSRMISANFILDLAMRVKRYLISECG